MNSRTRASPFIWRYLYMACCTGVVFGLQGLDNSHLRGNKQRQLHGKHGNHGNALAEYSETQILFIGSCTDSFLSDAVLQDGILSQKDFAAGLVGFCKTYTNPLQVGCEKTFTQLSIQVQLLFANAVCPIEGGMQAQMDCVKDLDTLNEMGTDFGYIVSQEMMPQVEMNVENMCISLIPFVFTPESGLVQVPANEPISVPSPPSAAPFSESSAMTKPDPGMEDGKEEGEGKQGTSDGTSESGPPEGVLDLNTGESVENTDNDNLVAGGDGEMGTGPIIGIATAAAACLLCFFLVAGRRYSEDEEKQDVGIEGDESFRTESTPDLKFLAGSSFNALADTGEKWKRSISQFDPTQASAIALGRRDDDSSCLSRSSAFSRSSRASGNASVDQIVTAIDKANWDDVYKLSSQLAEQEDLSTLSSVGKQNARRTSNGANLKQRAHLSEEDQERARTLDELVERVDWTGVAVTAALYAGESGSSRQSSTTSRRSFLDIVTGKPTVSKAAAAVSEEEDSPGAITATPSKPSALGALTDDTKSGTTYEGRPLSQTNSDTANPSLYLSSAPSPPRHTTKAAPPAGAFGLLPGSPDTDSSILLSQLKDRMDHAVESGDWDQVLLLSSEVEKNNAFRAMPNQTATPAIHPNLTSKPSQRDGAIPDAEQGGAVNASLKEALSRSVYNGDWALVSFYANQIREKGASGFPYETTTTQISETNAIVPATRPQSVPPVRSVDTSDSEMSKKHTIEKLVKAEKWKGVSILAGLYEMESKGSIPSIDGATPSKGWMDLLNLSGNKDGTPEKTRGSQYAQMTPPPQLQDEEVRLRSVTAGLTPAATKSYASNQRITELRHVDRVDGDIIGQEMDSTGLNSVESRPAKLLIPYWEQRKENSDGSP